MKRRFLCFGCAILAALALCACGRDSEITQFKDAIDSFCTNISTIDTAINNIDAESDTAASELLLHLDELDAEFKTFGELDFPDEFNYLEPLADESSTYMTEAVSSYHEVYKDDSSYNTSNAAYAKENYARAYKRVQIIIAFLHGEDPENMGLIITEE
ncbi:MAG: hypothetical protein IJ833_10995 [Lachnospiraceae bacterium]|nr:hypothetical protein [Lachnospiraceae bacterium]